MPDLDPGAYARATANLDTLTDTYGQAGLALVDTHWQAITILVLEAEPKATAVRVTPRATIDGGRSRLLFDTAAILPDSTPVPFLTNERLDRHLRAIYAVAGVDEFEDDHPIEA